jgi:sarcosine oxidase subunit gamma
MSKLSQPISWTPTEDAFVHDLTPITALGAHAPRIDKVSGATLTEVPDLALANVAARIGHETDCAELLGDAPGPGRATLGPDMAIWTGPDQWLLAAPYAGNEDMAARLKAGFGAAASVAEQTDAWVCFDLSGVGVEAVMELLCPINIRQMQPGDATRTAIHHLGCLVIRRAPGDGLRILGPRASAGSLHHAVLTAMHSALQPAGKGTSPATRN